MSPMYPPRVTVRNAPSPGGRAQAILPRCLGGCGHAMTDRRVICDVCWKHLPRRLQRDIIRFNRSRDAGFRQNVATEVEETCTAARRRVT